MARPNGHGGWDLTDEDAREIAQASGWDDGHLHVPQPPPLPPGQFCTWAPLPGWKPGTPCPVCGHSDLVHTGTAHCPVCELVHQATPAFRRQQERIGGQPARIGGRPGRIRNSGG